MRILYPILPEFLIKGLRYLPAVFAFLHCVSVSAGEAVVREAEIENVEQRFWNKVQDDPAAAMPVIDSVLAFYQDKGVNYGYAEALFGKAQAFYASSLYRSAIPYYFQAADMFRDIEDTCYLKRTWFNLASTLSMVGDNLGAIDFYKKSIDIDDCEEYKNTEAIDYFNLGMVFSDLELTEDANVFFENALNTDSVGDNITYRQLAKVLLAYTVHQQGRTREAITRVNRVLKQSRDDTLEWSAIHYYANNDLATYYLSLDKLDSSLFFADKAGQITDSFRIKDYRVSDELFWASYYEKTGKPDSAIHHAEQALEVATKIDFKRSVLEALEHLAGLYKEQGNYEKALAYKTREHQLADSMYNEQVRYTYLVSELNSKEESLIMLEQRAQSREAQIETRNYAVGGAVAALFILGAMLLYIKRQNERMKKLNKRLQVFNHEKDKIIASLTHDLRSPLSTISGIIELIRMKSLEDLEKEELMDRLGHSFNNLKESMESLLNWAIAQIDKVSVNTVNFNVDERLAKTVQYCSPVAEEKNISIEVKPGNKTKFVQADKDHFQLIIRNLLTNAIKFSPPGHTVDVKCYDADGGVTVEVADRGMGISVQEQHKIRNQIFFKKEGTKGEMGTGLGLRLVMEYVDANNGQFDFKSVVGEGSSFTVWFPGASQDQ